MLLIATKVVLNFVYCFKGGSWVLEVWVCEVKPKMRFSEGSDSKSSSLKFCTWFQRGLVRAGGSGV